MARIVTFSVPREDDKLLEWLEQKSIKSGLDKSTLVRRGLRLLMEQEVRVDNQLDRIEARQGEILTILRELRKL